MVSPRVDSRVSLSTFWHKPMSRRARFCLSRNRTRGKNGEPRRCAHAEIFAETFESNVKKISRSQTCLLCRKARTMLNKYRERRFETFKRHAPYVTAMFYVTRANASRAVRVFRLSWLSSRSVGKATVAGLQRRAARHSILRAFSLSGWRPRLLLLLLLLLCRF